MVAPLWPWYRRAGNKPACLHSKVSGRHDDVIRWKHFPRYWPFVRGIRWLSVNSPHKGQQREALMFSLICGWINVWVNNGEAGDLRRHRAHYDVIVMALVINALLIRNCFYGNQLFSSNAAGITFVSQFFCVYRKGWWTDIAYFLKPNQP